MDQSLTLEFPSKSDRHQFSPNDKNNDKIISNGKYFDLLWNSYRKYRSVERISLVDTCIKNRLNDEF